MKKKLKIFFTTFGVLSTATLLTSCSTSWSSWNKNGSGTHPQPPFPAHKTAPYIRYHVRDKDTLMEAWNEETGIMDLGKLNNQFEVYSLIGYLSKIKQDAGKPSIDNYWKYGETEGNHWSKMSAYINGFNSSLNIKFKYKNKISKSAINFSDLNNVITKFNLGIKNYDNTAIDKSKGRGRPKIEGQIGPWFHTQRAYDVAWHGISDQGLPNDISGVASAGADLINNDSVKDLQVFNATFALELSKLVNLPKISFNAFKDFMAFIDRTFGKIYTNDKKHTNPIFNSWLIGNKINLNVMQNGTINTNNEITSEIIFKGLFLIQIIK